MLAPVLPVCGELEKGPQRSWKSWNLSMHPSTPEKRVQALPRSFRLWQT